MRRPKRRRVFSDSSHVRFLAGGRIARAPFLTPAGCDTIVALSEAQAAEDGGWRGEDGYVQATVDLEVDRAPLLRAWLRRVDLIARVGQFLRRAGHAPPGGGRAIHALDDLFVVRYDAEAAARGSGQRALTEHVDGGDVSFMLALSDAADYAGGGTEFAALGGDTGVARCRL